MLDALNLLRDDYGWTGPVHITENGMADGPSAASDPLQDDERLRYVSGFLEWISEAIREGHDVGSYYLWSLMDNLEWSTGFSMKFGIAALDPATLDRVPKTSAFWYRDLIAAARKTRPAAEQV